MLKCLLANDDVYLLFTDNHSDIIYVYVWGCEDSMVLK